MMYAPVSILKALIQKFNVLFYFIIQVIIFKIQTIKKEKKER